MDDAEQQPAEDTIITWDPDDDFIEWDEPRSNGRTPISSMAYMAAGDFDVTRFKFSPAGSFILGTMNRTYESVDDPASAAYWARLGLIKTVHDMDDEDRTWALYVPESYYEAGNENRKYPLVFIWHGLNNPIIVAEQYGFLEEAADQEYIAVIPWYANGELYLSEAERIFEEVTNEYRIDTSRVYSTGFSLGGRTSLALALEKSDIFAAVVAGGTTALAAFFDEKLEQVVTEEGHGPLTQKDFENVAEVVPMMVIAGDCDVYNLLPYNTEDKVWAVNAWLTHEGINHPQTLENSLALAENGVNEVERKLGLSFDDTQIRMLDETYYIGRYYNQNGENTVTMVCMENGVHTTCQGYARLAFEFFAQHTK